MLRSLHSRQMLDRYPGRRLLTGAAALSVRWAGDRVQHGAANVDRRRARNLDRVAPLAIGLIRDEGLGRSGSVSVDAAAPQSPGMLHEMELAAATSPTFNVASPEPRSRRPRTEGLVHDERDVGVAPGDRRIRIESIARGGAIAGKAARHLIQWRPAGPEGRGDRDLIRVAHAPLVSLTTKPHCCHPRRHRHRRPCKNLVAVHEIDSAPKAAFEPIAEGSMTAPHVTPVLVTTKPWKSPEASV